MSNDYASKLLIDQRLADLRHEADQERLAHLVRRGQRRQRRWWEQLMLFRTHRDVGDSATEKGTASRPRRHQHHAVSLGRARG